MTQIKKFAWYGSSVAFAALLAVALLVSGPAGVAQAALTAVAINDGDGEIFVGEEVTVTVTDVGGPSSVTLTVTTGASRAGFVVGGSVVSSATVAVAANGTTDVTLRGTATGAVTITAVDGEGNTFADTTTIVAAQSPVTLDLTLPVINNAFGTGAATADVEDTNGDPALGVSTAFTVTGGAMLFVTASGGTSCSATPTAFTATTCNATTGRGVTGVAGQASAGLQGTGSGSYTLTATAGAATDSATGTIATVIGSVVITEVTRTTTQAGTNLIVRAQARDAAGNAIPNQNITFSGAGAAFDDFTTIPDTTCAATVGSPEVLNSGSSGTASIRVCIDPGATSGQTAIVTASATGSDNVTKTVSTTVTVAGEPATIEVDAPAAVAVGGTAAVSATVKDADGRPIAGVAVTFASTGGLQGNQVTPATVTTNSSGVATATFVSGGQAGNAVVTAVVGDVSGSDTINVGGTVPPEPGESGFTGDIADEGVSLVVFGGGTVAQLAEAAEDEGVLSISLTVGGEFVVYIVGAPAFVNADFNATFSGGIPAGTPVILYIRG